MNRYEIIYSDPNKENEIVEAVFTSPGDESLGEVLFWGQMRLRADESGYDRDGFTREDVAEVVELDD